MSAEKTLVLTHKKIQQKITRIAYEIVENNLEEEELVFVGIKQNGPKLAGQLSEIIQQISDIHVQTGAVRLNKENPVGDEIKLDLDLEELENKVVILVDDVANTGRTMMYAMGPFLKIAHKKILTTVLVDRQHKAFPICPDYVGLSLATTMQEHISVEFGKKAGAYLS